MKRFTSLMLGLALLTVAGCERGEDPNVYDPKLDGLGAIASQTADVSILENQAEIYSKQSKNRSAAPETPATPAPVSAPDTTPAGDSPASAPATTSS